MLRAENTQEMVTVNEVEENDDDMMESYDLESE